MNNRDKYKKEALGYGGFFCIATATLLLFALQDMSYGYYEFLRFIVFGTAGLTAYVSYTYGAKAIAIPAIFAAILFNPISPITMERETWQLFDIVFGIFFLAAGITFFTQPRDGKVTKN